jgi:hypothetical protein
MIQTILIDLLVAAINGMLSFYFLLLFLFQAYLISDFVVPLWREIRYLTTNIKRLA